MLYNPKKQKRPVLRLTVTAAVLGICLAGSSFYVSADHVSDLKEQYTTLQQQSASLQQQLSSQNSALKTAQQRKALIDAQVANTQKQIDVLQAQIDAANTKIAQKQKDIDTTQADVQKNYNLLKARLRALYTSGDDESYVAVLLSSSNLTDFLSKVEVVKTVSKHDADIVNSLKADEAKLKKDKTALDSTLNSLTAQRGAIAAKKDILTAQQAEQTQLVAQAKNAAANTQQQSDAVSQQASQTDAQINAEIAAQAAAARTRIASATATVQQNETGTTTVSTNSTTSNNTTNSLPNRTSNGASGSTAVHHSSPGTSVSSGYLLSYAEQFLGYPYVFGTAGPNSFDCSGFVQYVFANAAATTLPRTAAQQYTCGTSVSKNNLQPGDLVFFGGGPSDVDHVGIYVGGGQFIDAPNKTSVVRYDTLSYWHNYVGAKRILN